MLVQYIKKINDWIDCEKETEKEENEMPHNYYTVVKIIRYLCIVLPVTVCNIRTLVYW